jgi:hypothetical protein
MFVFNSLLWQHLEEYNNGGNVLLPNMILPVEFGIKGFKITWFDILELKFLSDLASNLKLRYFGQIFNTKPTIYILYKLLKIEKIWCFPSLTTNWMNLENQ